jgi:hypothetical protein
VTVKATVKLAFTVIYFSLSQRDNHCLQLVSFDGNGGPGITVTLGDIKEKYKNVCKVISNFARWTNQPGLALDAMP